MSFSYSGDPSLSPGDYVRFLLNDTSAPPFMEDEEIGALILMHPNVLRAAAACAERVATQLSGKATSKSVGGLSITRSQLRQGYLDLAKQLRDRALKGMGAPVDAGGLSQGEKLDEQTDQDATHPAFRRRTGFAYPSLLNNNPRGWY